MWDGCTPASPLLLTLSELSLKHTPADGVFMPGSAPHSINLAVAIDVVPPSPFFVPPLSLLSLPPSLGMKEAASSSGQATAH